MIRRTFSSTFLNQVSNHPEVRPWLGGEGEADWSNQVMDLNNVTLVSEGGGFVFQKIGEGLYEGHSQFLPEHRGAPVAADLCDALRYMFTRTDCVEIITRIPDNNEAARGLGRIGGFREAFHLDHDPKTKWAVGVHSIDLDRWRARDDRLRSEGLAFHDLLKSAGAHDEHPEDEAHDRAVGACIMMCRGGQAGKAVWAYNRWAAIAGYGTISLIRQSPIVINIGAVAIAMLEDALEVIQCP